ncbi:MAG: hypothetical protein P8184_20535 [Calditrichia bacterium]
MKVLPFLSLFFLIILFISCEKEEITGQTPVQTLTNEELQKLVSFEFTDYHQFEIKNQPDASVSGKIIQKVEFGEKDTGSFIADTTVQISYSAQGNEYLPQFTFSRSIFREQLRTYFFTLRFFFNDNVYADLDTFVLTYKYPYQSTEMFLDINALAEFSGNIQDFLIMGDDFYGYSFSSVTVFKYNLTSGDYKVLAGFPGGDHIAGNSDFIFLDLEHSNILRYNIQKDTIDLQFFPYPGFDDQMLGMCADNNFLYVMFHPTDSGGEVVKRYTVDGQYSGEFKIPWMGYYLCCADSILYSVDFDGGIFRYDMRSNLLLPEIPSPAESIDGIFVDNGKLYYADYDKNAIFVFALSEAEGQLFAPKTRVDISRLNTDRVNELIKVR